jgi:3-isopropylmalate/(R)-2-methylmalate dehydratase small subunit
MKNAFQPQSITAVTGKGLVVPGDDIDTDQIMPARFLKWITFQGMEAHVFEDLRIDAKAKGQHHPLDDPRFAGHDILLVNRNFGCGSSREHAPQGLYRFGIKAIIGESFGEIFAGNCVSIGMPCVVVSHTDMAILQERAATDPCLTLRLNLVEKAVWAGDDRFEIEIGAGRRQQFLEGSWDPVSVLRSAGAEIDTTLSRLPYAAFRAA